MPAALQTRLLRMLEEREVIKVGANRPTPVDVRVIAATHVDLASQSAAGDFRRDLYYRLNVLRLDVPALAQRSEDILPLGRHFLGQTLGREPPPFESEVETALAGYGWPGNVRELRNLMDRLAVFCESATDPIDVRLIHRCLPELFAAPAMLQTLSSIRTRPRPPDAEGLAEVLARVGGDRQRAAQILGVSRTTLWRWMRQIPPRG